MSDPEPTKNAEAELRLTFAVPVSDRAIFEGNFLLSPCVQPPHKHQVLVQENFDCAAKAYNDAIDKAVNDLIVFCHQDVILPSAWIGQLKQSIDYLEAKDPNWGVLGSCGMTAANRKWKIYGQIYAPGLGIVGEPIENPLPIQTLDGLLLILRKSSGLRFDERLPHFHFYGPDICLIAAEKRMGSYAIPAIAIHNSRHYLTFPPEYYDGYEYMRRRWKDALPIQTSVVRFTRSNWPMYKRRLVEAWIHAFGSKHVGAQRVADGAKLLAQWEENAQGQNRAGAANSAPRKFGYLRLYRELLFGKRPRTPETAVDYCDERPIRTKQVRSEVLEWTRIVAAATPKRSMEIGTYRGGTLFLLCTFSASDAQIISLDLRRGQFGGGYHWAKIPLFKCFARNGQKLRLVRGDSHQPETKRRIEALLAGEHLDFLFIDGDHTYEGVKRDFEMYAPLVRRGGIVAFHDIAEHAPEEHCEVAKFWNEIKPHYAHREIIENPRQGWAGIGILTMD